MYLIHNTSLTSLKSILRDGYLKSYSMLKKEGYNVSKLDNEGYGLYNENKFIFFSCIDELFSDNVLGHITLYFNSKILFNRTFYLGNVLSPDPTDLRSVDYDKALYKRKYNKYYKKYDSVLSKLYKNSLLFTPYKQGLHFQLNNQVTVLNKINLKELVGIHFHVDKPYEKMSKIINYITKYYPNVKILVSDKARLRYREYHKK